MKTVIKKISITLAILITALSVSLAGAFIFKPLGDVVFSVTMGSMYRKVGETCLKRNGKNETLAIYKADSKPFLIVGPCLFDKDCYDFFFVNKDCIHFYILLFNNLNIILFFDTIFIIKMEVNYEVRYCY